MSAYIVSEETIHTILAWVIYQSQTNKNFPTLSVEQANELGQSFVNQNYASVNYRYRENDEPYEYKLKPVKDIAKISPVQFIKHCNCLDYQCCETDDYEGSEMEKILERWILEAAYVARPEARSLGLKPDQDSEYINEWLKNSILSTPEYWNAAWGVD